jgi:hypothetical protein
MLDNWIEEKRLEQWNLFLKTICKIGGKCFTHIVDSGSEKYLVCREIIDKLIVMSLSK